MGPEERADDEPTRGFGVVGLRYPQGRRGVKSRPEKRTGDPSVNGRDPRPGTKGSFRGWGEVRNLSVDVEGFSGPSSGSGAQGSEELKPFSRMWPKPVFFVFGSFGNLTRVKVI